MSRKTRVQALGRGEAGGCLWAKAGCLLGTFGAPAGSRRALLHALQLPRRSPFAGGGDPSLRKRGEAFLRVDVARCRRLLIPVACIGYALGYAFAGYIKVTDI
jgi:hypothetical protein